MMMDWPSESVSEPSGTWIVLLYKSSLFTATTLICFRRNSWINPETNRFRPTIWPSFLLFFFIPLLFPLSSPLFFSFSLLSLSSFRYPFSFSTFHSIPFSSCSPLQLCSPDWGAHCTDQAASDLQCSLPGLSLGVQIDSCHIFHLLLFPFIRWPLGIEKLIDFWEWLCLTWQTKKSSHKINCSVARNLFLLPTVPLTKKRHMLPNPPEITVKKIGGSSKKRKRGSFIYLSNIVFLHLSQCILDTWVRDLDWHMCKPLMVVYTGLLSRSI